MRGRCSPNSTRSHDMVVYLRSAPVSEYNQELVRRDIGRMFLDAQRRGTPPPT